MGYWTGWGAGEGQPGADAAAGLLASGLAAGVFFFFFVKKVEEGTGGGQPGAAAAARCMAGGPVSGVEGGAGGGRTQHQSVSRPSCLD